MTETNHFSVTVSRVNESLNKDTFATVEGHTLTITADGWLSIKGEAIFGCSFSKGRGTGSRSSYCRTTDLGVKPA